MISSKLLIVPLIPMLGLAAEPQAGALTPEWDVATSLKALSAQAQRLKPILDQVKPQDWVAKGASPAYQRQLDATKNELTYLTGAIQKLSARPEKLTVALETYFRMQALETFLGSLAEGIRKYQNAPLADLLLGVQSENWNNREKLRQYIVDLATNQEQELKVMDEETQRCRLFLSQQPAPKSAPAKRVQ
ncbi:MAG: hypothetical protein IT160_19115 [Bryobacterales bacterium]|nr:hypothetical protein [Bryobacterales bacterium]